MNRSHSPCLTNSEILKYESKIKIISAPIPAPSAECSFKIKEDNIEKEYKIPIIKGSDGTPFIDMRGFLNKSGYSIFDPGLTCTAMCSSTITYIDGAKGELFYRGYKIEDLCENCDYMEVCYLLIYGVLPNETQKEKFEKAVISEMLIHEQMISFYKGFKTDAHPMAIMTGVVGALSAFMHLDIDVTNPRDRELTAIKLIAKMPTIAAISYRTSMGLPIVYPKKEYSYIKNFLYMMFFSPMEKEFRVDDNIIKAVNICFILHADHEQNASTTTVRICGSSLANPYACIAAGIASLWGPAHGGANEEVLKMLQEIKSPENIPKFLEDIKNKVGNKRLMGFGHRIYKCPDPRAKIMDKMLNKVLNVCNDEEIGKLFDLALKLEESALKDDYFRSRKLFPNVDFYSGLILKAIGIPISMFTVMFAVARSIGWITQWSEMMNESLIRIERPKQLYLGPQNKKFIPINERGDDDLIHQGIKLNKMTSLYQP